VTAPLGVVGAIRILISAKGHPFFLPCAWFGARARGCVDGVSSRARACVDGGWLFLFVLSLGRAAPNR
jgi:hypothetical protein